MNINLNCLPLLLIDHNQKIEETNFKRKVWSSSRNSCFHGDTLLTYNLEQRTDISSWLEILNVKSMPSVRVLGDLNASRMTSDVEKDESLDSS